MPVIDVGVADVIGAATMLISETALELLEARASGTRSDADDEEAA
jgi:hypothetical protein